MTIGVCDVNPDETQRTVYFLRSKSTVIFPFVKFVV